MDARGLGAGVRRRAEAQADLMNPNPMPDLRRKAEEGGTAGLVQRLHTGVSARTGALVSVSSLPAKSAHLSPNDVTSGVHCRC